MNNNTRTVTLSGLLLARAMVLPFITGQIPWIASRISLMHIPVFLAGYMVGGVPAMLVGIIAPVMRSMMFGMPRLFPSRIGMAFELGAYGLFLGTLWAKSKKDTKAIYSCLIIAMLGGRIVWGIASYALYSIAGNPFTVNMFMAGAFINAVPAIIIHILLIPLLAKALQKAGILK